MKRDIKSSAQFAALEALGLCAEEAIAVSVGRDGPYEEFRIETDWLDYDCYVDTETCEIAGIDCTPHANGSAGLRKSGAPVRMTKMPLL
jgi:hypothetical protein